MGQVDFPKIRDFIASVWDAVPDLSRSDTKDFVVEIVEGGYVVSGLVGDIKWAHIEFRFDYEGVRHAYLSGSHWPEIFRFKQVAPYGRFVHYRDGQTTIDISNSPKAGEFREKVLVLMGSAILDAVNNQQKEEESAGNSPPPA